MENFTTIKYTDKFMGLIDKIKKSIEEKKQLAHQISA